MSRGLIIDGYNVIHRVPELRALMDQDLERAREGLLDRAAAYRAGKKIAVTVVFDGAEVGGRPPAARVGVRVRFSRHGEKADPLIKRLIDQARQPRLLTVVSSDQEIVRYARQYGCTVQGADDFVWESATRRSASTVNEKPRMSAEALEEWLRLFEHGEPEA